MSCLQKYLKMLRKYGNSTYIYFDLLHILEVNGQKCIPKSDELIAIEIKFNFISAYTPFHFIKRRKWLKTAYTKEHDPQKVIEFHYFKKIVNYSI